MLALGSRRGPQVCCGAGCSLPSEWRLWREFAEAGGLRSEPSGSLSRTGNLRRKDLKSAKPGQGRLPTVADVCDWYLEQAGKGAVLGRPGVRIKSSTLAMDLAEALREVMMRVDEAGHDHRAR
jgi:hypothetical protein